MHSFDAVASTPLLAPQGSVNGDLEAARGADGNDEKIEGLKVYRADRDGSSSPFWAFVNLTNAIVGSAFLGLPFAFGLVGLGPGLAMVTFIWIVTTYSGRVLLKVSRRYQKTNYTQLAEFSDGAVGLISLAVFQLGLTGTALVAFVYIAITNSAPAIAGLAGRSIGMHGTSPSGQPSDSLSVDATWDLLVVCASVTVAVSLGISFFRYISSLSIISLCSLIATAVSMLCVVYDAFDHPYDPVSDFWMKKFEPMRWAAALGVMSFAFLSQHLLYPVANSLRSAQQFDGLFGVFNTASVASYIMNVGFGIIGYVALGGDLNQIQYSFLLSYCQDGSIPRVAICIAQLGLALTVVLTYPSELLVARHTIRMLLDMAYTQQLHRDLVQPGVEQHLQRQLWLQEVGEKVNDPDNERSWWLHVILTMLIWAVTASLGLYVVASTADSLGLVAQIPGPIASAGLAFLLPALIHLRLGFDRDEERPRRWDCTQWTWQLWASAGVLLFGVVAMVAAVAGAVFAAKCKASSSGAC